MIEFCTYITWPYFYFLLVIFQKGFSVDILDQIRTWIKFCDQSYWFGLENLDQILYFYWPYFCFANGFPNHSSCSSRGLRQDNPRLSF